MNNSLNLSEIEKKVLNHIQKEFPLVPRPFKELANMFSLAEEQVMECIKKLKSQNIIRQISGIFSTPNLGYKSCLVAFKVPEENVETIAMRINQHPGVSHNYLRNYEYNLWFTFALHPLMSDLLETVRQLAKSVNVQDFLFLPVVKMFKIKVEFDMGEGESKSEDEKTYLPASLISGVATLTEHEIRFIQIMQEDIPVIKEPFLPIAKELNLTQQQLFDITYNFLNRGLLKRYAALLDHYKAGFNANLMVVWKIQEQRIEEIGKIISEIKEISHCYQRVTYPNWQYNFYTMIHAKNYEQCQQVVDLIREKIGINDYMMLYSQKEFKKVRLKYFLE